MNSNSSAEVYTPLVTEDFVECPLHMLEMVQLHDPATHVFTDFTHNRPALISSHVSIDEASKKMKLSGEHLLLVVDDIDTDVESGKRTATVIGQVTACDIQGEAPIRLVQADGIHHDEILVSMVMTPRKDIKVLAWSTVKLVKVGDIIATMRDRDCCHLLVVDEGRLRGIFSKTEISKHIDHEEFEPMSCAQSLAELVHRMG